jgi:hypothetical protein
MNEQEKLISSIEKLTKAQERIIFQNTYWHSLLRGLFWAIGSTIGFALFLSIVIYLLRLMGLFNYLSPFFNNVSDLSGRL